MNFLRVELDDDDPMVVIRVVTFNHGCQHAIPVAEAIELIEDIKAGLIEADIHWEKES